MKIWELGTWRKPIAIPNRLHFKVKLMEGGTVHVGRHEVLEMRESKDTGNVFVRFVDESGKEFYGLLIQREAFFTVNRDGYITSCVEADSLEEAELNDTLPDTHAIVCIRESDLKFIQENLK